MSLAASARGLSWAREKCAVLAWDEGDSLYLIDQAGALQARTRFPERIAAAAMADDGSTIVIATESGSLSWLLPDLSIRRRQSTSSRPTALAVDPQGNYVVVATENAALGVLDPEGRTVWKTGTPRAFCQVTFVVGLPFVIGLADYSLIACFDFAGHCMWRHALVAHFGSLSVSGEGELVAVAAYTEGLIRFSLAGKELGRSSFTGPCRLASVSFDGKRLVTSDLSPHFMLLNRDGALCREFLLDSPPLCLHLSPLGDRALVANQNGKLVCMDLSKSHVS